VGEGIRKRCRPRFQLGAGTTRSLSVTIFFISSRLGKPRYGPGTLKWARNQSISVLFAGMVVNCFFTVSCPIVWAG